MLNKLVKIDHMYYFFIILYYSKSYGQSFSWLTCTFVRSSNVTLSLSLILFVKEKNLLRKREKKYLIQVEAHIKKKKKSDKV